MSCPRRMSYLHRRAIHGACHTCMYVAVHGIPHTCDGVRGRLWLRRLPTALSYLRVQAIHDTSCICDVVRSRPTAYVVPPRHTGPLTAYVVPPQHTGLPTEHVIPARTWPFTAHRVPASASGLFTAHGVSAMSYVAVYGIPRICVGVRDHPRRMAYL